METNYIGAFVLTNLLMPLLKNSPVSSRVVNVTSFTHRCGESTIYMLFLFIFLSYAAAVIRKRIVDICRRFLYVLFSSVLSV
jgi:NAD(P)-dependent dehydrogenase (short-subunit alcohol dehydrogenase family)